MDFVMFRCRSEFILFFVALVLCLGNGASMNLGKLSSIMNYLTFYGSDSYQYAVAIRLDKDHCENPTLENLETALPRNEMLEIHNVINAEDGLYAPQQIGNIVAAGPKRTAPRQHAELRLLSGHQNSPVERMLANKDKEGCLIFFSKLSPCVDFCLSENKAKSIVKLVNELFKEFRKDSRAFVFKNVYYYDQIEKKSKVIVEAWSKIKNAPLFRYPQRLVRCFDNKNQPVYTSPCLTDE